MAVGVESPPHSLRPDTSRLVAALWTERSASLPEDTQLPRRSDWFAALHAGSIRLTTSQVVQMDGALALGGLRHDLLDLALSNEHRPYCEKVRVRRASYGVAFTPAELNVDLDLPAGLEPLAESVRDRDRLITTGPVLRASGLLGVHAAIAVWAAGVDPISAVVLLVLPLLMRVLVESVQSIDEWLTQASKRRRSDELEALAKDVHRILKSAGIPVSHKDSFLQPGALAFLIPSQRDIYAGAAGYSDIQERTAVLSFYRALTQLGAGALTLAIAGADSSVALGAAVLLAFGVVDTVRGYRSRGLAAIRARQAVRSLGHGLGLLDARKS